MKLCSSRELGRCKEKSAKMTRKQNDRESGMLPSGRRQQSPFQSLYEWVRVVYGFNKKPWPSLSTTCGAVREPEADQGAAHAIGGQG